MKHEGFSITSSTFQEGGNIPSQYTCDGRNISPPISWSGAPTGTKCLALIVDDPDAPSKTWVHWVIYNIPASRNELAENITATQIAELGARGGKNDFGKTTYGGPCPPSGVHHYHFKLYALDTAIAGELDKDGLLQAMEGHTLATTELIGLYERAE
jgi:Raf kinase inhibitor-like YbhB/YbcL family protein